MKVGMAVHCEVQASSLLRVLHGVALFGRVCLRVREVFFSCIGRSSDLKAITEEEVLVLNASAGGALYNLILFR
jgi:hypothetical protein